MTIVKNQNAYNNAIQRNIKANARKTRSIKWKETTSDWKQLHDWLFNSGEFSNIITARNVNTKEIIQMTYGQFQEEYDYEMVKCTCAPMCDGMFENSFGELLSNLKDNLIEWGGLSEKQTNLVRDAFLRKQKWVAEAVKRTKDYHAKAMTSKWIGEVKERRDFTLTIKKVLTFHNNYGYNSNNSYINIMVDQDGNSVIGKGTKFYGEAGTTISVRATITKHDLRDGVHQTIINRPKFGE